MRVALVSGCDGRVRFASPVGHQLHARRHGLDYHLELAPFPGRSGYWHKLAALQRHLDAYDWVVWLDDDAFVTDPESRFLLDAIEAAEREGRHLVIAPSTPEELNGAWAAYNTGVMALRNGPEMHSLLDAMGSADLETIEAGWDHDRLGMFTHGDQDALAWALEHLDLTGAVHWADPLEWNARPWYYERAITDRPVCHFAGQPDKTLAIHRLARRMGVDTTLVPGTTYDVPLLLPLDGPQARASRAGLAARASLERSRQATKRVRLKARWIRETGRWS